VDIEKGVIKGKDQKKEKIRKKYRRKSKMPVAFEVEIYPAGSFSIFFVMKRQSEGSVLGKGRKKETNGR
jgi:hypothetical protein